MDMENNNFDILLKNKIKDIEVPYDASTWDVLNHKLEIEQMSIDNNFDSKIRAKLTPTTNENMNWAAIEKSLDNQLTINKLLKSKVIEASLLVILLFGANQFFKTNATNESYIIPTESNEMPKVRRTLKQRETEKPARFDNKVVLNSNTPNTNIIPLIQNNAIVSTEESTTATNIEENKNIPTPNVIVNEAYVSTRYSDALNFEQIGSTQLRPIEYTPNAELGFTKPVIASVRPRKSFKLGLFFGKNINDVTAEIRSSNVNSGSSKKNSSGTTVGTTLNIDYGKFGIETGLNYSTLSYQPLKVEENPFRVDELLPITAQVLQLPINVNFYLSQSPTFKTFVTAGAAMNVALKANYNVDQEIVIGNNNLSSAFNDGLLLNGWKNNYYFNANFGLGAEYKVNPYLSAFAQASVQLHTGGASLGTYNDRINSYGLRAGLKMVL
jgi:hypothetical protein